MDAVVSVSDETIAPVLRMLVLQEGLAWSKKPFLLSAQNGGPRN